MVTTSDIRQRILDDLDAELQEPVATQAPEWQPTPKMIAIIRILRNDPMLTDWVLRRLVELKDRISHATIHEMYTEAEIEQLREEFNANQAGK